MCCRFGSILFTLASLAAAPSLAGATGPRAGASSATSPNAARIAAHFNVRTEHKRDYEVHVAAGALLRDSFGTPLYATSPAEPISVRSSATLTLQRQPVVRDAQGHRMVYLWGHKGTFREGARRAPAGYSGYIRLADVAARDRVKFPKRSVYRNRLDGRVGSAAARRIIGTRTIAPVHIAGTHVGRHGTADHPLSDYGYAHGRMKDFAYGAVSVLGRVTGGGQVGVILPRGHRVHATDVTWSVPNTRGGSLPLRLCLVDLPDRPRGVRVAMWFPEQILR